MKWLVIGVLSILLLSGCRSSQSGEAANQIGTVLTYEYDDLVATPSAPPETVDRVVRTTLISARVRLASGDAGYEMLSRAFATTYKAGKEMQTWSVGDTHYTRMTSGFVLQYHSLQDAQPETTLKLPLAPGASWHAGPSTITTVVGRDSVTTEAGAYPHAWKVEIVTDRPNRPPIVAYAWFDPATWRQVMIHSEHPGQDSATTIISHGELVKVGRR